MSETMGALLAQRKAQRREDYENARQLSGVLGNFLKALPSDAAITNYRYHSTTDMIFVRVATVDGLEFEIAYNVPSTVMKIARSRFCLNDADARTFWSRDDVLDAIIEDSRRV